MIYQVRVYLTEKHDLAVIASSLGEAWNRVKTMTPDEVRSAMHTNATVTTKSSVRFAKPAARQFQNTVTRGGNMAKQVGVAKLRDK